MKSLTKAVIVIVFIVWGGKVFSEDKTPNLIITGTVTTDSCNVDTDSQNLKVPLGDVVTGRFVRVGDTSPSQKFNITLTDCDTGVKGASITFTGTSDSDNPDLLQITKDSGAASGIAVEIMDETSGSPVPLGKATTTKALTAGENSLPYSLRYKSTLGTVTAGSANAVMFFDLTYQ
ncbi:fimbrial protein [Klebsiella aerogenes]|uniref:fimbrial protein n=1 Tax=Klebsiella aerogenes TaxID=548 RepID=UPI001C8EB744|nr:fimbrial protein [Klebsiella aerogenes]MDA3990630.1 fimbrial protein [Klebsiella aerogenes]